MGTLVAQPANAAALHCYASGGVYFDSFAPGRVLSVEGVRGAHLVTAGRAQDRWCLVLEPHLAVQQNNAAQLRRLMGLVGQRLGLTELQLVRHVERRDGGRATDLSDWLKI